MFVAAVLYKGNGYMLVDGIVDLGAMYSVVL